MEFPAGLRYSKEHEWVRVEGDRATVGITDYAQDALGDVVYVDLPEIGSGVSASAACAEVESTKSVSEIYAPVSGSIVAVNSDLADRPELINQEPFGGGWIFTIELTDPAELDVLMDAAAYRALVEEH